MESYSDRHVGYFGNEASSSPPGDTNTEPPPDSPPPYSYYDPNYVAKQTGTQTQQQEDEGHRRRRPEMVERQTVIKGQQEDEGRRGLHSEMEERQSFLRAQHEQARRYRANMGQQLYNHSIAKGINTDEYRPPDTSLLVSANNNQERLDRHFYDPFEAGPLSPSAIHNREGIDIGGYRFPNARPPVLAKSDQETLPQHMRPEAGPSTRTRHHFCSSPHVYVCIPTEDMDNTVYTQPAQVADNQASTPNLPEVRVVAMANDSSSPFQEIQGEDQYSREKRYHIWRWARRVKKVEDGRDHNSWYKHARVFQRGFEKKTKDSRAKQEVMPWRTHLGRAIDDFGRGLE